jgi:histone-lysine N-methyltransferase SETD2
VATQHIIEAFVQKFPGKPINMKKIYNIRQELRQHTKEFSSVTHELRRVLSDSNIPYAVETNADQQATAFVIVLKDTYELFQRYGTVLAMDCTYKTNIFNMPMLHVVSKAPTNQVFSIAIAFMSGETQLHYDWVLKQLDDLLCFDKVEAIITDDEIALQNAIQHNFEHIHNIICLWHINKAVFANCRKKICDTSRWDGFMSDWYKVCSSNSEEVFEELWKQFLEKYADVEGVSNYFYPKRDKFVKCFVDSPVTGVTIQTTCARECTAL